MTLLNFMKLQKKLLMKKTKLSIFIWISLKYNNLINQEDAKMLTEEGELISNLRGLGVIQCESETYAKRLENIINQKILLYQGLKTKMEIYK